MYLPISVNPDGTSGRHWLESARALLAKMAPEFPHIRVSLAMGASEDLDAVHSVSACAQGLTHHGAQIALFVCWVPPPDAPYPRPPPLSPLPTDNPSSRVWCCRCTLCFQSWPASLQRSSSR